MNGSDRDISGRVRDASSGRFLPDAPEVKAAKALERRDRPRPEPKFVRVSEKGRIRREPSRPFLEDADEDGHVEAIGLPITTLSDAAGAVAARNPRKDGMPSRSAIEQGTSSSSWTGRLSARESARVIVRVAPLTLAGLDDLIAAVEEKRHNDPEVLDAIEALQELHHAVGELLREAKAKHPLSRVGDTFVKNRERVFDTLKTTAKVSLAAPATALGVCYLLCKLSGLQMDTTLLSSVYGAMVGGDVLKSIAANKS